MANKNPKQTKQFRDSQGRFARVSKETARKAGQKGAEVSNRVQAEKRTMKETLVSLLDIELDPDKVKQRIVNLGYPETIAESVTPRLMIALGFINRCMGKGDPNAIKLLLEIIGEYVQTMKLEGLPQNNGELTLAAKRKD